MMPDEKIQPLPLGGPRWHKPPWYERRDVWIEIFLLALLVLSCLGAMYFFANYIPGRIPGLEN